MTSGLPRSWDSVGVGHMVLIHESPADGWWEAVVVQREDEVLTLRFRDYPKVPTFVRHISAIGPRGRQPGGPREGCVLSIFGLSSNMDIGVTP